jgi:Protein of unknown function (DUF2501)
MAKLSLLLLILMAILFGFRPAHAQMDAAPIPSALPKVSSISVANAAGVLNYCVKNNLVSSTSTDQLLTGLSNKPDLKSADYMAGHGGQILGDGGKNFAIATAPAYLQSQACDLVLQQAKTFK